MRKHALLPIFLVYFLDNLSFAVVFPLFSSLILTTQFHIVPLYASLALRTTLLGILNASFPLALLIGSFAPLQNVPLFYRVATLSMMIAFALYQNEQRRI